MLLCDQCQRVIGITKKLKIWAKYTLCDFSTKYLVANRLEVEKVCNDFKYFDNFSVFASVKKIKLDLPNFVSLTSHQTTRHMAYLQKRVS